MVNRGEAKREDGAEADAAERGAQTRHPDLVYDGQHTVVFPAFGRHTLERRETASVTKGARAVAAAIPAKLDRL